MAQQQFSTLRPSVFRPIRRALFQCHEASQQAGSCCSAIAQPLLIKDAAAVDGGGRAPSETRGQTRTETRRHMRSRNTPPPPPLLLYHRQEAVKSGAVDGADSTSCRREVRDVAHAQRSERCIRHHPSLPFRAHRCRPYIAPRPPGKGYAHSAARPRPSDRLLPHIAAHTSAHSPPHCLPATPQTTAQTAEIQPPRPSLATAMPAGGVLEAFLKAARDDQRAHNSAQVDLPADALLQNRPRAG